MSVACRLTSEPAGCELSVHSRVDRDVLIVSLLGQADLATERALLSELRSAAGSPPPAVVLDVVGLTFCSAHSIWDVAGWTTDLTSRGVFVAVVGASRQLMRLWLLTDMAIPWRYATVEAAVDGLRARFYGPDRGAAPDEGGGAVDVLRREVQGLRQAMQSRAAIEQAKGMVMAEGRCTAEVAFSLLSRWSQLTNRRVSDIAAELVRDPVQASAQLRYALVEQTRGPRLIAHR